MRTATAVGSSRLSVMIGSLRNRSWVNGSAKGTGTMRRIRGRAAARRVVMAAIATAVTALLAACGPGSTLDTAGSSSPVTSPASASPATTTPAGTTGSPAGTGSQPWANVNVGAFGKDPIVQAAAAWLRARTEAGITDNPRLPAFVALTSASFLKDQTAKFQNWKSKHLTVPRPGRWAMVGVTHTGSTARVRACVWGPSGGLMDARTKKWAEPVTDRWYGEDMRLFRTGGAWKVDQVYDATFSCAAAR